MASLRDTVKDYQDELRDGIAWVAFWKQGRSWNAEYFHLDMDDGKFSRTVSSRIRTLVLEPQTGHNIHFCIITLHLFAMNK